MPGIEILFCLPPLGEGGAAAPDEGRVCRYYPLKGSDRKFAPHQSAARTASPSGEAFWVAKAGLAARVAVP